MEAAAKDLSAAGACSLPALLARTRGVRGAIDRAWSLAVRAATGNRGSALVGDPLEAACVVWRGVCARCSGGAAPAGLRGAQLLDTMWSCASRDSLSPSAVDAAVAAEVYGAGGRGSGAVGPSTLTPALATSLLFAGAAEPYVRWTVAWAAHGALEPGDDAFGEFFVDCEADVADPRTFPDRVPACFSADHVAAALEAGLAARLLRRAGASMHVAFLTGTGAPEPVLSLFGRDVQASLDYAASHQRRCSKRREQLVEHAAAASALVAELRARAACDRARDAAAAAVTRRVRVVQRVAPGAGAVPVRVTHFSLGAAHSNWSRPAPRTRRSGARPSDES